MRQCKNTIRLDSRCDISDYELLEEIFWFYRPAIIINCAAYTNVDKAETEKSRAYQVNTVGPKNLALLCEKHNAILIHISTDYVFSGLDRQTPYEEGDQTQPLGYYGASKLKGEVAVTNSNCQYYIFRTSWLYGGKWGLLPNLINRYLNGQREFKVANDTISSPTYSGDLAAKIIAFIEGGATFGTYHAGATGACTWHEFISYAFKKLRFEADISKATLNDFGLTAERPRYSALSNDKMANELLSSTMLHWKDGMDLFLLATHHVSLK